MKFSYDPQVVAAWCQAHLQQYRADGSQAYACCPFHEDRSPSAQINLERAWLVCHACSASEPLSKAATLLGVEPPAVRSEGGTSNVASRPVEIPYTYLTADGEPYGQVIRKTERDGQKRFFQRRWNGSAWEAKAPAASIPYRLERLAELPAGELVLWVEGEKDVETAWAMGLAATTSPQGAKSFNKLDKDCLRLFARRSVVIIPDNDAPGRGYAHQVEQALVAAGARVAQLELVRHWPAGSAPFEGCDLSDWRQAGGRAEELRAAVEQALTASTPAPSLSRSWPDDWDTPTLIDRPAVPTFPLDVLPDRIRRFVVEAARQDQVPVDLVAIPIFVQAGVALQGRVAVSASRGKEFGLNIWGLTCYPSGGGKSRSTDRVFAPTVRFEMDLHQRIARENEERALRRQEVEGRLKELSTVKARTKDEEAELRGLRGQLKDCQEQPLPKLFVSECTSEAFEGLLVEGGGRAALVNSEASDLLEIIGGRYASNGGANTSIWLNSFSRVPHRTSRVIRGNSWLQKPTSSIYLSIQPTPFEKFASNPEFTEKGFWARFGLFAKPLSLIGTREIDPEPVSRDTAETFGDIIRTLHSHAACFDERGEPVERVIEMDRLAIQAYLEFCRWAESELGQDRLFGEVVSHGARLGEMLAKVSGLLHCLDNPSEPWERCISEDTVRKAVRIIRWSAEHYRLAFGGDVDEGRTKRAEYLLERIRSKAAWATGFYARDLYRLVCAKSWYSKSASELERDLNFLAERGYLRLVVPGPVDPKEPRKVGRPGRLYLVHPSVFSKPHRLYRHNSVRPDAISVSDGFSATDETLTIPTKLRPAEVVELDPPAALEVVEATAAVGELF